MLRKSPTRTEVFMAANRHNALKSTGPKAASGQTVDGMRNKGKICLRGGVNTHEGVLGQTTGEVTCWDRKRQANGHQQKCHPNNIAGNLAGNWASSQFGAVGGRPIGVKPDQTQRG